MSFESISDEILASLPPIGSDPETPLEMRRVRLRFFDPSSSWSWYVLEFDGEETFFGLVATSGLAAAGQFSLTELSSLVHRDEEGNEVRVALDEEFQPVPVGELARESTAVRRLLVELELGRKGAPQLIELEGTES